VDESGELMTGLVLEQFCLKISQFFQIYLLRIDFRSLKLALCPVQQIIQQCGLNTNVLDKFRKKMS
jgi:hypothetical protein